MQTFLPFPSFTRSARVLDRQRLGKQRVETWQILKALAGQSTGWRNHPASLMWRGYEHALIAYGVAICLEWRRRGYRDQMLGRIEDMRKYFRNTPCEMPPWLGADDFHRAHRSNLTRKAPEHYAQHWDEPNDLPYVWPLPIGPHSEAHNG